MDLSEGLLVSHDLDTPVEYIKGAIYQQNCYEGAVPMLNTNMGLVLKKFSQSLPTIRRSWEEYTRQGDRGSFAYSVVPIIYSISILAVITWFLTLFILTNYTIKSSLLLKSSTILSSVFLLITVVKSLTILHNQQRVGYLHGASLLESINDNLVLNIFDLIVVILLQINQVQVIMRIFLRQNDKRLTFFVGIIACLTSQVIWAVTKFHNFDEENEAGDILPAFIYLVRIAMAVCYAALISVFQLSKISYIVANKDIWLLSLLTIILIYSPVAFFIADVANAWVYELSEIFSVVTYVICVVIPWEWCNKFNMIMKIKEKEGVLGRKFYEDEMYELDRFELFVEQDTDNEHSDGGEDLEVRNNPTHEFNKAKRQDSENYRTSPLYQPSKPTKLVSSFRNAKSTFLNLTDKIIATGLAIPRSVSISTPPIGIQNGNLQNSQSQGRYHPVSSSDRDADPHLTTNTSPNNPTTTTTTNETTNGGRRRDVFVYSRREVILNTSDDDS